MVMCCAHNSSSSAKPVGIAPKGSVGLLQQQLAAQKAANAAAAAAASAEPPQPTQPHLLPSSDSQYSFDGKTGDAGAGASAAAAKKSASVAIGKRPSISAPAGSGGDGAAGAAAGTGTGSVDPTKRENKWFNLVLEEMPFVRELMDSEIKRSDLGLHSTLQIEVMCLAPTLPKPILLERWNLHYEPNEMSGLPPGAAAGKKADPSNMYKRMIIFIRSLFSYVRLLPAYHLYKLVNASASTALYEQKSDDSRTWDNQRSVVSLGVIPFGLISFRAFVCCNLICSVSIAVQYRNWRDDECSTRISI